MTFWGWHLLYEDSFTPCRLNWLTTGRAFPSTRQWYSHLSSRGSAQISLNVSKEVCACVCKTVFNSHAIWDPSVQAVEHSIQIRDLTFHPPYSSAAGQCKAAPVTQIGREQLNKWHWATHECSCGVKEVGEGFGGRKEKKKGGGGGWQREAEEIRSMKWVWTGQWVHHVTLEHSFKQKGRVFVEQSAAELQNKVLVTHTVLS